MAYDGALDEARRLMGSGRWPEARDRLTAALAEQETATGRDLLGATTWWLGEVRESLRHRERAFALYLADGASARATVLALDISVCYLTNLDNGAAARGWLARASRLAETAADDRLDGWVWLVSGYTAAEPQAQRRLLERALGIARTRADVDLELVALADLGLALVATGDAESGFGLLDEAMAGTQGGGYQRLETVVWTSCSMLAACSMAGDLQRARQWCDAADRFMDEFGCPFLQARCRAHYGRVLVATGQWESAERELSTALSMASDTGRGPREEATTGLAELRLRQGRLAEAGLLLDDCGDSAPAAVARGELYLALARPDRATAVLETSLEGLAEGHPDHARTVAALVEARVATGALEEADRLAHVLERLRRGHPSPSSAGLSARAAGTVAAAEGRTSDATRLFRTACAAFSAQDLTYDATRARHALAVTLSATDPTAAVVEAETAHRQFVALGALRDADATAALLRGLGVPARPGPRGLAQLSQRELEVLDLLEQGLTNPQIGERLFISRKTVAHHVSSILLKLGLESRVEAATLAAHARASHPGPVPSPGNDRIS